LTGAIGLLNLRANVYTHADEQRGTVLPMARAGTRHTFALSAGEAVLGLLIERPGNSYQLERRLEARFSSAGFAHGTAYHAIRRLARQGLIRPLQDAGAAGDLAPAADVTAPGSLPATAYEATPRGLEHFRGWLHASSSTPPVREELLAKLAFCGPSDLPRMVEIVRDAELACTVQLQELNQRIRAERLRAGEDAWRRLMSMIVLTGDVAWWDGRIRWLQELRAYLQQEGRRFQAGREQGSIDPPG
jgi:hypothetical protein